VIIYNMLDVNLFIRSITFRSSFIVFTTILFPRSSVSAQGFVGYSLKTKSFPKAISILNVDGEFLHRGKLRLTVISSINIPVFFVFFLSLMLYFLIKKHLNNVMFPGFMSQLARWPPAFYWGIY